MHAGTCQPGSCLSRFLTPPPGTGTQVLRQGFWPTFIKDICGLICGTSLLNEQLCCNTMVLFSLVCEKVCNFPLR